MPAVDAVIVAAIVAAFVIFAGVLAWVEHQTRDLPRFDRPRSLREEGPRIGEDAVTPSRTIRVQSQTFFQRSETSQRP
jgi:hypothetical protein